VYLGSKALENHFLLALKEPSSVVAVETVECVEAVLEVARLEWLESLGRASAFAIMDDCSGGLVVRLLKSSGCLFGVDEKKKECWVLLVL